MGQEVIRHVLNNELARRKARNSSYSLRSFARRLDISSGSLSAILNGKRKVSKKLAMTLVEKLDVAPDEKASIENAFADTSKSNSVTYRTIDLKQFHLISEWQYFAMLSLARAGQLSTDVANNANRLGISEETAQKTISTLLELELIQPNADGLGFERTDVHIQTSDGIRDAAIQRAHRRDCEMAEEALDQVDVELRDFSSITFCLQKQSLKKLKQMIFNFQNQVLETEDRCEDVEVFRMSCHVFPLTPTGDKK